MNIMVLTTVVVLGLAVIAGVSMALYIALPQKLLDAAQHGRYAGLGVLDSKNSTPRSAQSIDRRELGTAFR